MDDEAVDIADAETGAAATAAIGSGKHFDAAFELYHDARATAAKLTESAYASLLRICVARGDLGEARRLFDEMRAGGELPHLRTFLPLLQGYTAVGDIAGAFAVYEEVLHISISRFHC
jgi:pentatricopeptide repeat protein